MAITRWPRACPARRGLPPATRSMRAGVASMCMSSMPQAVRAATTSARRPPTTRSVSCKVSPEEGRMSAKWKWLLSIAGAALMALTSVATAKDVTLSFYYPIAVGGPIPKIIDGYVADFEKENPGITIKAIYAGTYQDTLGKALTPLKSGETPDVAVPLSTDMFTLTDEDAIAPFDDLLKTDADKAWAKSFYPAFMANSQTGNKTSDVKTWGIPFQRSTIVMFWNKDAFKAAGLNPDKAPDTWDELVADGK